MKKNELENVKVGDQVAPMRYISPEQPNEWTGSIHVVSRVTPQTIHGRRRLVFEVDWKAQRARSEKQ